MIVTFWLPLMTQRLWIYVHGGLGGCDVGRKLTNGVTGHSLLVPVPQCGLCVWTHRIRRLEWDGQQALQSPQPVFMASLELTSFPHRSSRHSIALVGPGGHVLWSPRLCRHWSVALSYLAEEHREGDEWSSASPPILCHPTLPCLALGWGCRGAGPSCLPCSHSVSASVSSGKAAPTPTAKEITKELGTCC